MNFRRSLRLVGIHNKQIFLKLRYDLGRELVVLISSLVLMALFAYIFRDFLSEKLKVIPLEQQLSIAKAAAFILLLLVGPWVASPLHRLWREEPSMRSFALRSGETPEVIQSFLLLQTLIIYLSFYGLYWLLIGLQFGRWNLKNAFLLQLLSIILSVGRILFLKERRSRELKFQALLDDAKATRIQTMSTWRIRQLLYRNRMTRLCLALATLLTLVSAGLLHFGSPYALNVLIMMAAGVLSAAALSFQLEEDMRAIWFERQIASSHEEYVSAYQRIAWQIAIALASIIALMHLLLGAQISLSEGVKLGVIAGIFPLIFPAIMFQIAPERPMLPIMTITLIGLFLGTAIFAHWGAIALVPVLIVYAKQYQRNQFYRS